MSFYRNTMWNEDITVFHKVDEIVNGKKVVTWEKSVYEACFWQSKDRQSIDGKQFVMNRSYIVRIPVDMNETVIVAVGDVVVQGVVSDTIITTPTELLRKYEGSCFTIGSVVNNTKLQRTAHWLITDNR